MALSEAEQLQIACSRYAITVIGGDVVFLADRRIGHKLHLGPQAPLNRPEFRRYVDSLNRDLHSLSTGEFFEKYGIKG